jgi:uncharacterized protein (DUF1697 family)
VVEANPLEKVATDPTKYLVTFVDKPAKWPQVNSQDYEPEQAHLTPREAYFWLPNGIQRSKLLAAYPPRQTQTATTRNWNTVTKLLKIAEDL